jgi:acetamidase/formamidase
MKFTGLQLIATVKNLAGEPVLLRNDQGEISTKQQDGKTVSVHLSVKEAIRQALTAALPTLQEDEAKKFENYMLAREILSVDIDGSIDLVAEKIAYIKKKVALTWGIEIIGYVFEFLEGKTDEFKSLPKLASA